MRSLTRLCCVLAVMLPLAFTISPLRGTAAANFTVDSLADTPDALPTDGLCADASGACTLRAAIEQANADAAADAIGFGVNGTINLTGPLPDVSTDMTISGPGSSLLTVRRDTGGDYRIFTVRAATVSISGLAVSNGRTGLGDGGGHSTGRNGLPGGGIFNSGTLTLTACDVRGNSTSSGDFGPSTAGLTGRGGGIHNEGTLTMHGCGVSDNQTAAGFSSSQPGLSGVPNGGQPGGDGGGISNTGVLTMTDCVVSNNRTGAGGVGPGEGVSGGRGGGIANFEGGTNRAPVATLTNCTVSGNRTGAGAAAQGSNRTSGFGGHGGGIFNISWMTLNNSTVEGNVTGAGADAQPGVVSTAGSGGSGGGIYHASTKLTITNCVVKGNATGRGGVGSGVSLSQGNGGDGGGIAASEGGTPIKLSNSTVVQNQTGLAGDGGGRDGLGGGVSGGGRLRSTIISSNFVRFPTSARDVSGRGFESFGYNFIEISSGGCCFDIGGKDRVGSSSSPGATIKLDPVTLVPQPGSVAIDAGLARDIDDQPVNTDRRGATRPFDDPAVAPAAGGDNSDIGAFERQDTDPTPTPTPTPTTVQFSAATSTVSEGCVQTEVTMTRSGPKDGTTVASYGVNDFAAHQRGDFTYATGRVTFAPGEDSKTVPVLINEDAYAEGDEELIVFIYSATGGQPGSPSIIKVRIVEDDAVDGADNPIDDDATFVCQHYHDFLSRQPDPEGLAFWTGQLSACAGDPACLDRKREDISAAFFLSIEFQATGYFAIRVEKAAFGDRPGNPRYLTFLGETQKIGRDVVVGRPGYEALLEANKQLYAEEFVARADFQTAHGSQNAGQYVDSLFANAGAAPTQGERDAAVDAFGAGDTPGRARALRSVVESGSVYNKLYNPAFVLMQYFAYLRRNPDNEPDNNFDGYNFWLAKLDAATRPGEDARDESVALGRVRRAEMVRAFLLSAEYRGRFQGEPGRGSQRGFVTTLGGAPGRVDYVPQKVWSTRSWSAGGPAYRSKSG